MAFNWKNRNVTYKHINLSINKITKDAPWYNQLGATLLDPSSQTNDNVTYNSGILIFNAKLKSDINKAFLILRIGIKEKLKLNVEADVLENNRIFIKFYRVMPPKASPAATQNLRLMYAVEDPDSSEHQKEIYKHPEMIEVNDDGTFELPIGDYGRRGWEIIYVSKTTELYKYLYRYQDKPYLPIDNLTIDFSNNGKLVKKDEIEKITEPDKNNMCEYKIPYFGIQDRSIIGTGYYGGALYENNNFTTKNKVKPFNSTKPRYWNLSNENYEIIYDGEVSMNDSTKIIISKNRLLNNLIIAVGTSSTYYSLGEKDRVLLYVRRPGQYTITRSIPYFTYIYDADINNSDIEYNLNQWGVVDICKAWSKNSRKGFYSNARGIFSSEGVLSFNPMDIIGCDEYLNNRGLITFSTQSFPHYRNPNNPDNLIPCQSFPQQTDLYRFYSHIIKQSTQSFLQTISWIDDEDPYNATPVMVSDVINKENYCFISDSASISKPYSSKEWKGTYSLNVQANIPSLTNKKVNITFKNEQQCNSLIQASDGFYSLLNFIKIGGSVEQQDTTAGLVDYNCLGLMGLLGNQKNNTKLSWTPINFLRWIKDGDTRDYSGRSYYISESQSTINTQNVNDTISIPIQLGLKTWIGWSTRTLPTSYAIWVVIWRWSDKTN